MVRSAAEVPGAPEPVRRLGDSLAGDGDKSHSSNGTTPKNEKGPATWKVGQYPRVSFPAVIDSSEWNTRHKPIHATCGKYVGLLF